MKDEACSVVRLRELRLSLKDGDGYRGNGTQVLPLTSRRLLSDSVAQASIFKSICCFSFVVVVVFMCVFAFQTPVFRGLGGGGFRPETGGLHVRRDGDTRK